MRTPWPADGLSVYWDDALEEADLPHDLAPVEVPADMGLRGFMAALSEEHYCAGWMQDLELDLWCLAKAGGGHYGMGTVTPVDAALLLALATEAGCWWRWSDDEGEPVRVGLGVWRRIHG